MKDKELKFKFEDNKQSLEKLREEFKKFYDQIDMEICNRLPNTKLVYAKNQFESFLYCDWCSTDYYDYFDDEQIEKFEYCPFCGAKIMREKK